MVSEEKRYSALFLDRDGVINYKIHGYVQSFDTFRFIPGSIDAICNLRALFDYIIIITNQQGIGKGIMNKDDLLLLHNEMVMHIESLGGYIDNIYFCPHLESINCYCRKPNPGMILQAKTDYPNILFSKSYMIGDSDSDILAAQSVGVKAIKVNDNYLLNDWSEMILSK